MRNYKRAIALYFSPTNTTRTIVCEIARSISNELCIANVEVDITSPRNRIDAERVLSGLNADDIVVFGSPVYIGRMPNLLVPYFKTIKANGALGIAVAVYGNRAYDDGLIELRDIMQSDGFACACGAAFVGEHSFSKVLAAGRPNAEDMTFANDFGKEIAKRAIEYDSHSELGVLHIPGNEYPYKFFNAKSGDSKPIDMRKVKPVTDKQLCNGCGLCADVCPMSAIDRADFGAVTGTCIRCCACVKRCPNGAKSFTDATFLSHLHDLEVKYGNIRGSVDIFWS